MDKKNIADIYKLSPIQKGMLFAHLIEPDAGMGFLQTANLYTALDHDCYVQAWQQLIERHTTLRAAFFWENLKEPLQVIMRHVTMPVKQLDWRGRSEAVWRKDIDALIAAEWDDLFDLTKSPLLRLTLITLDNERSIAVLNFHHINIDGWSIQVLLDELHTVYAALKQAQTPRLPVVRPFRDYVRWLEKQDLAATVNFWRNEIADFTTPTGLPDVTRPEGILSQHGDHNMLEATLPSQLVSDINAFLHTTHFSFSTLMQAAWSLLLARYNEIDDVVTGMIFHGRPTQLDNFERMIGMFINALPVRIKIPHDTTTAIQWIAHCHNRIKEMEKHAFLASGDIHKLSPLRRSQPLFETLVVDQMFRTSTQRAGAPEPIKTYEKNNFLLTLYLRQRDLIWLDYAPVFVDQQTAENLIQNLFSIVEQIVNNPQVPVAQINLSITDGLPQSRSFMPPSNGKQPKSQQSPTFVDLSPQVDYVAPRNELEQQLVAIWQDVLAKDNIGIRHDFFELGGHSLMAIQVIARIREAFGVEMPLRQLFEQPTVAALATFLQGDTLKNAIPALVPAERGDTLPLSFSQERLWFFTQFQPEAAAYNITLTIELHGALDSDLLTQALQLLVQRHESLRTTFVAHNGIPQQVIAEQGEVCLHVVTCGEDEVEGLISAETHHAFDLSRGPLLRTTILQLNPTRQILILSMHHIISDGWSINLLFSEVTAYYAALDQGVTPQPAPLPVQYPDYAIWQRHWLQGDVLDEQLTHWQATLANAPTVLNLPTDYPRPPLQTFNGAAHFVTLPSSLTPQLEAVGKAHNATPFMTFLAAYNVLLWHLSGQDDIVVGSPIAGRDQQATEGLIGMFINTLALRTRLDTTQTFSALLAQVREATLDAYAYQAVPLAKLLDTLALERDLSRSPLFQTLFALQNTPNTPPTTLASIQIQPYQNKVYTVQADLTFTVVKIKGQWRCEWNYNTDLFAPETIEKMAALFNHLLDNIVTQAETVLTDLPALVADKLATAQEIALFDQWNDTNVPFPADKTLAQLFHEQVMNNPLGTALVFEGQSLTYARLNARANQVAHKLLQMGVSAETPIAIYLDRSFDLFIAMLAINKAGAAYLPLDANMPRERIRYMLNDAKVSIIITTAAKTMQLPAHKAAIMQLNPRWEETFTTPTNNPPTRSTAQQLANIIYTSGSTGQPKGVCVTQVGITRLVKNAPYIEFLPTDRVLQFGATTFDAATLDIWGALLNGAALYIYPSMQFDLVELATYIADNAISFAAFTPSLLHQLVDYQVDKLQSLRYLLVGGDVLSVDHADRLRQACPNTTLINAYGPTENTVDTTHYIVPKTGELGKTIPIGKPVSNTQLYILDEQLRRVALGRSGELYVGGAGVARGYLFKPELTAQAFIDNPFLKDGSKIYATGDLVRFRPNGDLEFIGRKDSQVKLRGYRIEMGEIEHALGQHPAIGSHLVTLRADDNGNKMLIAYLVATQPETPTRSELETHLQQWLPAYMVPRYFIWLDALPLTHNGKIDQRALPLPDHARPEMADQFVAPRNELEQQLAAIWQAVLSLDSVGIHDDFFDLGGHSLLATQIVARMRTALGVELSLRQLFELPTIAELADLLQHDVAPARPLAPAILPAPRDGTLPLSFSQERLWFLAQLQPDSTAYNLALAFEIQGVFDTDILGQALHLLIQRHESLRTTFTTHDDLPQQTIAEEGAVFLHIQQCTADQVRPLITAETQHAFDLARGPLLRTTVLQVAPDLCYLIFNMHHIISDGWSISILAKELSDNYIALVQGKPINRPPLPIQFADYAIWQRNWLQDEVFAEQVAYWQTQLANTSGVLNLPTDYPRPLIQTYRGADHQTILPNELATQLMALSQAHNATVFMTLLAAFNILLWRYSGQSDIVLGSPIAGRQQQETEALIGMLINTLVLRTQLDEAQSFVELLNQVRETTLDAYAYQHVPLAALLDKLAVKRDLSRSPLFQVLFILQNTPAAAPIILPDAQMQPYQYAGQTAQFDLTLNINQVAGKWLCNWNYNTDLFAADTIERMAAQFETLLGAIGRNPQQPLHQLPLLSSAETHQLLHDWNNTQHDYDLTLTLADRFEAQAAATPAQTAVTCMGESLTYAQLNARANTIAQRLQQLGAQPGQLIGLAANRSLEMLIGLLAILKSGAAYVPIDPDYPDERVQYMIDTAALSIIVTQTALQSRYNASLQFVLLDQLVTQASQNPQRTTRPTDCAYVIFTSGSTGKPKGVQISQQALVNFLLTMRERPGLSATDTLLAVTTISFDIAALELYTPLLVGGHVIITTDSETRDSYRLADMLSEHSVTVMQATPATWRMLLAIGWQGRPTLKILSGGEALPQDLAAQLYTRGAELWNMYGPTEATVWATIHQITDHDVSDSTQAVTIGKPIANTRCYILDKHFEPTPIGVIGNLYIGGVQVAQGYLGQPDLTAERFITLPISPDALYKTGDLARYHADGTIEFLGREDFQVKIRGFRIELGEIEAQLVIHAAVREAVVTAQLGLSGESELIAYIIAQEDDLDTQTLRQFLGNSLPRYMIPTRYVMLDHFPLTPNGKIDRLALPNPEEQSSPTAEFVAPSNATEQLIADIWQRILRIDRVSIHANFFEIGGESILGIQVIGQLRKAGFQATPEQLFQFQTIATLAAALSPLHVETEFPLTIQQRAIAVDAYHCLTLSSETTIQPAQMYEALKRVTALHSGLRLTSAEKDPLTRQTIITNPTVCVCGTETTCQHPTALVHVHQSSAQQFDLLVAARWVDAASLPILIKDMWAAYSGFPLIEPTAQFTEWLHRLQKTETISLPKQLPSMTTSSHNGQYSHAEYSFSAETTTRLQQLPDIYDIEPATLLAAAIDQVIPTPLWISDYQRHLNLSDFITMRSVGNLRCELPLQVPQATQDTPRNILHNIKQAIHNAQAYSFAYAAHQLHTQAAYPQHSTIFTYYPPISSEYSFTLLKADLHEPLCNLHFTALTTQGCLQLAVTALGLDLATTNRHLAAIVAQVHILLDYCHNNPQDHIAETDFLESGLETDELSDFLSRFN